MAQHDIPNLLQTDPDGPDLAALLDNFFFAQKSGHSGASRPGYALEGLVWSQIDGATKKAFFYDGAADRELAQINDVVPKSGGTMTGALNLPAGGLNVGSGQLLVNSLGHVLKPNHPVLSCYRTETAFNPTVGQPLFASPNVGFDVHRGIQLNQSNGRATVPATGAYLCMFYTIKSGAGASHVMLRPNGVRKADIYSSSNGDNTGWETLSGFSVYDLAENDYLDVAFSGGSAVNQAHGSEHMRFVMIFLG